MSTNGSAFRSPVSQSLSRAQRAAIGETLLLRFLVQHGLLPNGLLKAADVERRGAGSSLSLLDWLVRRGHVSESALTFAIAHCLRLGSMDNLFPPRPTTTAEPVFFVPSPSRKVAPGSRRRRIPLRLVHGHLRSRSDYPTSPSASRGQPTRPRPFLLPRRPA